MKCLNEPIARQANQEDGCTGHFWESRFKSQALLTEEALLKCMAYVDLNPIRAKMASTPETSDYTSIKTRIENDQKINIKNALLRQQELNALQNFTVPMKPLMPLVGHESSDKEIGIFITQSDYQALVEQTGRIIQQDKRGAIANQLPDIFNRINFNPDCDLWLEQVTKFEECYQRYFSKRKRHKQKAA